jgi:hypothetical protein
LALAKDQQEAQKELAKGLADQLAEKMLKTPLDEESRLAVIKTLRTLPGFSFSGFAKDDQTNSLRDATRDILRDQIKRK